METIKRKKQKKLQKSHFKKNEIETERAKSTRNIILYTMIKINNI